jgi:hypothetical protein
MMYAQQSMTICTLWQSFLDLSMTARHKKLIVFFTVQSYVKGLKPLFENASYIVTFQRGFSTFNMILVRDLKFSPGQLLRAWHALTVLLKHDPQARKIRRYLEEKVYKGPIKLPKYTIVDKSFSSVKHSKFSIKAGLFPHEQAFVFV